MDKQKEIKFSTLLEFDNPIVRDHRVHGTRILPGVTFLDIVYRGLSAGGIDTEKISIRNIVFKEPIAVTEDYDKMVEVRVYMLNGVYKINLRSLKVKNDRELTSVWDENFEGEVFFEENIPDKSINIQQFMEEAKVSYDIDKAYEFTRKGEIQHYEFMKARGTIYEGENWNLSHHFLSNEAKAFMEDFYMHPAHLDSSTIVPAIRLFKDPIMAQAGENEMRPYIPIYLQSFFSKSRLEEEIYVLIRQDNVKAAKSKDIVYIDIEIYNGDGQLTACIKRLANKRIRNKSLIEKLKNVSLPVVEKSLEKDVKVQRKSGKGSVLEQMIAEIQQRIAALIEKDTEDINCEDGFYEQDLDSGNLLELVKQLESVLNIELYPTLLFEYNNINDLAAFLAAEYASEVERYFEANDTQNKNNTIYLTCERIVRSVAGNKGIQINEDDSFYEQGLESTDLLEIVRHLEAEFDIELFPTLLFEYNTLSELILYIENEHGSVIGKNNKVSNEGKKTHEDKKVHENNKRDAIQMQDVSEDSHAVNLSDIAVIGVSGIYPEAGNIYEFWDNLKDGKDCIREIPSDRWDHAQYYSDDKDALGKYYSKWGGFIQDIDKFDPLFFNIAPKEAEFIDPQERLFLESVWNTFEDAGYKKEKIDGKKVGVFAGVMYGQYQLLQGEVDNIPISPISFYASIANRASYYFNLKGPSIALDTMCSSSLTTIHLACESIRSGESEMAVAGGVNLTLHPNKYIFLSQQKFASSDGKCRAFGEGGDGYVCGEGVGTVLLKSLHKARQDGDRIYAVVRASAINAGGKSSGFTVPNVSAQSELIQETIDKAGIKPESITYIEAHGTGTSLGDPIEISALTKVFAEGNQNGQQSKCVIGSVKSNIGHLESAAGIAAFTKTILQLYHKKIVPSLHTEVLNQNIDFNKTPFTVSRQLMEWENQMSIHDGKKQPLRAGISSFGAGGSNAHIILEEYVDNVPRQNTSNKKQLIVLSARTKEQLYEFARSLANFVEKQVKELPFQYTLENIAYTLQKGKNEMRERAAFEAYSVDQLLLRLNEIGEHKEACQNSYFGTVKNKMKTGYTLEQVEQSIGRNELGTVAQMWVEGVAIEWSELHHQKNRIIGLPTYPFAKERYWVTRANSAVNKNGIKQYHHPLIDYNESDFYGQRYVKVFSGNEPFIRDHVIHGKKILPAVIYFEMVREAMVLAEPYERAVTFRDIVLLEPIVIDNKDKKVVIQLVPTDSQVRFKVTSGDSDSSVHAEGVIYFGEDSHTVHEDIKRDEWTGNDCSTVEPRLLYENLKKNGFNYGHSLQGVQKILTNHGSVMAELVVPDKDTYADFGFNPAIMDSALQTVSVLSAMNHADSEKMYLPYSFDEIHVYGDLTEKCYAMVKVSDKVAGDNMIYYHIDIFDENNKCVISFENMGLRSGKVKRISQNENQLLLLEPIWQPRQLNHSQVLQADGQGTRKLVIFDNGTKLYEQIRYHSDYAEVWHVVTGQDYINNQNKFVIRVSNEDDYQCLFKELQKNPVNYLDIIIHWKLEDFTHDAESINRMLDNSFYSVMQILKSSMKLRQYDEINLLYLSIEGKEMHPIHGAMPSLLKSAAFESKKIKYKALVLDQDVQSLDTIIMEELRQHHDLEVRYQQHIRMVKKLRPVQVTGRTEEQADIREHGVYIITGGMGGIGKIFSQHIAKHSSCNIVLTGRRHQDKYIKQYVDNLNSGRNGEILYISADMCHQDSVNEMIQFVKKRYGKVNGVIHGAGVLQDSLILGKSREQAKTVLEPKILGTIFLDKATENEELDFLVTFSSTAAVTGNMGQSDYAFANGFMDEFAVWRNKERKGKTVSINWPLWKNGGMQIEEHLVEEMRKTTGVVPLENQEGITAFQAALEKGTGQLAVLYGNGDKIMSKLSLSINETDTEQPEGKTAVKAENSEIKLMLMDYLKEKLGKEINLDPRRIAEDEELESYGIDSVLIINLTKQLEKDFGSLSKTLFYEYQTIEELAAYFAQEHNVRAQELLGMPGPAESGIKDNKPNEKTGLIDSDNSGQYSHRLLYKKNQIQENRHVNDVAIIGISGSYPKAEDLEALWENLKSGTDCIEIIPKERWDWKKDFAENKNTIGTAYGKWGGFLEHYDEFDPMFFSMTPLEAEFTDPQERLFLQTAWSTIEDAAYTRKVLEKSKVGVFVGVMSGQYQLYGVEEYEKGNKIALSSSYAAIANRISYFMNFRGPSMAVDTMCSSSVTAIKIACDHILNGDCDLALAGGVNLNIHPNRYLLLSQGKFLSTDGKCRSFGQGGDGYVPGEGVGAVLLKPLNKAVEDGDNIYAVIKGCAVNHGGKTNGFSVPNPTAQCESIRDAIHKSGIPPESVNYIETHGTGTSLGDPIEMTGLEKALKPHLVYGQKCAIGSIKSNIGHLEGAAGIAAITKVILQMKHKMLVPSLHSQVLNKNINFENTNFYVQQKTEQWRAVEYTGSKGTAAYPRRAGISSFGAGGSNSHLILESYDGPYANKQIPINGDKLFILSARSRHSLLEYADKVLHYIEGHQADENLDGQIMYTYMMGREHWEARTAIVYRDMADLRGKLEEFADKQGECSIERVFSGILNREENYKDLLSGPEGEQFKNVLLENHKWEKVADLWVKGVEFDWDKLFNNRIIQKVSCPTYAFERGKYWIPGKTATMTKEIQMTTLHPLIHENVSTLFEEKFISRFNGDESILKEHQINGRKILPAAAYIEMARAASSIALDQEMMVLRDIKWMKPVDNALNKEISTVLESGEGEISFRMLSEDGKTMFSCGKVMTDVPAEVGEKVFDMLGQKSEQTVYREDFYRDFEESGLTYGDSFQKIELIQKYEHGVVGKLRDNNHSSRFHNEVLTPYILDTAFQLISILLKGEGKYLPYEMKEINIFDGIQTAAQVVVIKNKRNESTFDAYILSESEQVLAVCYGILLKEVQISTQIQSNQHHSLLLGILKDMEMHKLGLDETEQLLEELYHEGKAN